MSIERPVRRIIAAAFIDERNENTCTNQPFGLLGTNLTVLLLGPTNTDLM